MSDVCLVCSRAKPAHAQEGAVQHHVCQPSGSGPLFKQASGLPDTAGDTAAGPAGASDGVLQGQIQASPFLEAAEGVGAGAGCIVGPGQLACLSWPAALLRKHCRLLLTLPHQALHLRSEGPYCMPSSCHMFRPLGDYRQQMPAQDGVRRSAEGGISGVCAAGSRGGL